MKCFVLLAFAILFSFQVKAKNPVEQLADKAQKADSTDFGLSIGIGVFYPKDINDYIRNYYQNSGKSDIYQYFSLNAFGSIFPAEELNCNRK